jgi:hypothetical protein
VFGSRSSADVTFAWLPHTTFEASREIWMNGSWRGMRLSGRNRVLDSAASIWHRSLFHGACDRAGQLSVGHSRMAASQSKMTSMPPAPPSPPRLKKLIGAGTVQETVGRLRGIRAALE